MLNTILISKIGWWKMHLLARQRYRIQPSCLSVGADNASSYSTEFKILILLFCLKIICNLNCIIYFSFYRATYVYTVYTVNVFSIFSLYYSLYEHLSGKITSLKSLSHKPLADNTEITQKGLNILCIVYAENIYPSRPNV